jgi:hypothetical protein
VDQSNAAVLLCLQVAAIEAASRQSSKGGCILVGASNHTSVSVDQNQHCWMLCLQVAATKKQQADEAAKEAAQQRP